MKMIKSSYILVLFVIAVAIYFFYKNKQADNTINNIQDFKKVISDPDNVRQGFIDNDQQLSFLYKASLKNNFEKSFATKKLNKRLTDLNFNPF